MADTNKITQLQDKKGEKIYPVIDSDKSIKDNSIKEIKLSTDFKTKISNIQSAQDNLSKTISGLNLSKVGGGEDEYINSISESSGKVSATKAKLPEYTFKISQGDTSGQLDFSVEKDGKGLLLKTLDFEHSHTFSEIQDKPDTLEGYGITNAVTAEQLSKMTNGAVVIENHGTSDTTFTLTPNVFHLWGEVGSLNLTLGTETAGIVNEFVFQFTSPSGIATKLTLPGDLKFYNDQIITIEPGKIYQGSIINKILVLGYA